MAERRIAEQTGRGVVCFISNYGWLDQLSFTGMRERYLEAFDVIRVDCLNGDSRKTGKIAPDGSPEPKHLLDAGRPGVADLPKMTFSARSSTALTADRR